VIPHTECSISVTDKSGISANQTTYSDKKLVADNAGSESFQFSGSAAANERISSEATRSISPVYAKKNTDRHRSSTSCAEKNGSSNGKKEVDGNGSNGSKDRRRSENDRKKQSSSNRRRSRSPVRSPSNKRQRNLSPEQGFHSSRERAAKEDNRFLSARGKDHSPEGRLHTSKERDAKDNDRSLRKSPGAWDMEELLHDVKYREHHNSGRHSDKVAKETPSSSSLRRRSPRRRSPSDTTREQDRNREVNRLPHLRRSSSREKPVAFRHEQDEQKSHSDLKIESLRHSSSSRHDDIAIKHSHAYQENWFYSGRDAASRNNDLRSRRSSSCDRVAKPHTDGKWDKSVQNRHAAERSELCDRSHAVGSSRSPSYDKGVLRHDADRSRDRRRSVSKDRHGFTQSRDYSRPDVKDYSTERLSADDDRNRKTGDLDRYERSRSRHSSSRGNRECSWEETGDYLTERFYASEENSECLNRRYKSSHSQDYRASSPSDWLKLPRHTKHSPSPYDRHVSSTYSYDRSLSRECSPEYQRRESVRDRNETSPSLRDVESRSRRFEKRSYDRDERSSSRSRRDVSYYRSPSRKERDYFFERQRSLTPSRGVPTSPVGRESFARNRRSTSRGRRFVERRESNAVYRSSRSPSQRAADSKRVSPCRSRCGLQEELERSLRRKRSASAERRSNSADRRRWRKSSERRSRSRERRSRSRSRESPSLRGAKCHRSRADSKEDTSLRRGSRSPLLQPSQEAKHSNRDIVQFLMDTGIIASSKSDSSSHGTRPAVDISVSKPHTSVVSTSASQSVASSVAIATQVTNLSNSSFASSYPVVPTPTPTLMQGSIVPQVPIVPTPTPTLMQGSVVPQVPYVDNTPVPYMPCAPYPPTPYLPSFPVPPSGAQNPWCRPPGMQPCNPFPNQATPIPYPAMQQVPAVPGIGPGPPNAMQQCSVPGVHSTPAGDWRGSYSQTYNTFPETTNQPNFIQQEDRTCAPRPTFSADMKNASGRTGSSERPKQESELRPRHSSNSALIKAIADSAVWIPAVDSSTAKTTHHVAEPKSSNLSEITSGNMAHSKSPAMDSSDVVEPADKTSICEKSLQQQDVVDPSSALQTPPAGCLWECIPEIVVDAKTLVAMEASSEAEFDSRGKKRRRGQSASEGGETRRRSSRLRSKEEKKLDKVDDVSEDQPSDPGSKAISDTEQSKPPVKNLKARILQEYESDTGNPNPSGNSGVPEASVDAATSTNPITDAGYKVPAESCSPLVTKPEKVKSRWRRWSELESDGEQGRLPPPPPPSQSPSSTTRSTPASDDKDIVEEKPPYFEPILDNIFLSVRLAFNRPYA